MCEDHATTAAFSGHRTYCDDATDALRETVEKLYARGIRTFLCGMAVGFDLAAAEAVLALRDTKASDRPRLIAVVPFQGQERRFSAADRDRFARVLAAADCVHVLSPGYYAGCYAVRNNYLVDHAATLVAWYDGSPGGTHYTVRRAVRRGLEFLNLHPTVSGAASDAATPGFGSSEPTLF
ncbi:SLOG family protein [uncultured Alistipes sp.]|uniref:SLOG family protein n=1 Tax=uncultured Alistipes sp. TaxID=538949 RepID=UPI0025CDD7A5|nr:SLOG family protein [uncultured Alistipes sp.]